MTDPKRPTLRFLVGVLVCVSAAVLMAGGCGRPNQANIELRRQVQDLESQIAAMKTQREGDRATIRALEQQRAEGSVPALPQERLDQLFTTHGIRFGRLTGGVDLGPATPGDEALRVYVVPIDQHSQPLKAAGAFVIEAFDLSRPDEARLGRWEFDVEQSAKNWYGEFMQYTYAFNAPWDRAPSGEQVTVRVTFRDALTGREFTAQSVVRVTPPQTSGR